MITVRTEIYVGSRLEGCSYRRLERYSSDDAVKKMREALEENVSRDASENEQSGKGREG